MTDSVIYIYIYKTLLRSMLLSATKGYTYIFRIYHCAAFIDIYTYLYIYMIDKTKNQIIFVREHD